ncbi:tRNA isopentenyltransferase MiaA [Janibacter hoylei PVAS-1]|uniref:tRNA isopentenyltransferase MiaA n=1 Tax=Janibacter hoylei PVAS-1 TaxID=1210046 RepID=K1ERC4_9MICO|nr:tRNA isopentenyltransferase MiaA [Janibacter hoylei PVAS-1]
MTPQVIAVVGATATGKSDLALDLAEELGGEVVNADAMQLYRGMDIGTNKLPPDERRGIPHHLLDVLDVTDEATLADFQQRAEAAVVDILDRGRVPVLAGGSGLYVRAALDHLDIPPDGPAGPRPSRGGGRGRSGSRRPASSTPAGRPRSSRGHRAQQHPSDHPGPRGRRDHRSPLLGDGTHQALPTPFARHRSA